MLTEVSSVITAEPCIYVPVSYNRCSPQFWRKWNVIREELRCAETPAPPAQGRQGESETLRRRKAHARQAARACQEAAKPQNARPEKGRISKKRGTRVSRMPLGAASIRPVGPSMIKLVAGSLSCSRRSLRN